MLCASVSCWARLFLQQLERQIFVNNPRNWWSMDPRLTWNFSHCSMALRFVFLTQEQWLNCLRYHQYSHCVWRWPDACRLFWTSPAACGCCCSSNLCSELCYKLSSVVTFTSIQIFDQNFVSFRLYWTASKLPRLLDTASKFALFSVSGLKDEKLIKKAKPTWKLKYANSSLETFEYFCQIWSKSIVIISGYTVAKLGRFLRHSVDFASAILDKIDHT